MSRRIIHIPLSGGDRKAQAKGIRYVRGVHESHYRESVLIRSAAETKIREADRAWSAKPGMRSGEPARRTSMIPANADPIADVEKIAAECFRAVIFDGIMQERPDRREEIRASKKPRQPGG